MTAPFQRSASLRTVLKRGTLVTTAHWPLVVVLFVADAIFKLLIGTAVVGGMLLVGLSLGHDLSGVFDPDVRAIVESVGATLSDQPVAFTSFVVSLVVALMAGTVVTLFAKAGAVSVLAAGEAALEPGAERRHVGVHELLASSALSVDLFARSARRCFRRYVRLAMFLAVVYALSASAYLFTFWMAYRVADATGSGVVLTVIAGLATTGLVVWMTLVNWGYLLVQMVIAHEDLSVRRAAGRAARFVDERAGALVRILAAMFLAVVAATAASVVTTAGLGAVSVVPLVGLAVLPLQAVAWLVRGLVFQFLGLMALSAYFSVYREWLSASGDASGEWAS